MSRRESSRWSRGHTNKHVARVPKEEEKGNVVEASAEKSNKNHQAVDLKHSASSGQDKHKEIHIWEQYRKKIIGNQNREILVWLLS